MGFIYHFNNVVIYLVSTIGSTDSLLHTICTPNAAAQLAINSAKSGLIFLEFACCKMYCKLCCKRTLGHVGILWDILGQSGTLWETLGHYGKLWDTMGKIDNKAGVDKF